MKKEKIDLAEICYQKVIEEVICRVERELGNNGWVPTWWLQESTGILCTKRINYYLNKKVKEGKLVKKVTPHCTMYHPVEILGYEFDGIKFNKIKLE